MTEVTGSVYTTVMKHLVFAFALGLFCALSACGGAQAIPADAKRTTVSLTKIDCAECGEEMVSDLRKRPGVYEASFDKKKAEITVVSSPSFDVFTTVKQLAAVEGFTAVLGEGKGQYIAWASIPEGADVQTVAKEGEDVADLAPYVAAGKVTIIDFSAQWCMPCRKLDEHMVSVLKAQPDVAYRKLDIGDWDSPLAKRYLRNVPALPYVIVYGVKGARIAEISGLDLPRLDQAIAKGKAP